MLITLYGIKNCDSVKKARAWLDSKKLKYRFHDFRVDGLDAALADSFIAALGGEAVLNKRSTTWKQLTDKEREAATGAGLTQLVVQHPTLIKRPVLRHGKHYAVGFKTDDYAERLL